MTMFVGSKAPFAALAERGGMCRDGSLTCGVDDVDAATEKVIGSSASLIREKSRGPAGEFAVVKRRALETAAASSSTT